MREARDRERKRKKDGESERVIESPSLRGLNGFQTRSTTEMSR